MWLYCVNYALIKLLVHVEVKMIRSSKKNESGIAIVEYALLLGALAVAVYGVINWTSIGTAIAAVIADIVAKINPS